MENVERDIFEKKIICKTGHILPDNIKDIIVRKYGNVKIYPIGRSAYAFFTKAGIYKVRCCINGEKESAFIQGIEIHKKVCEIDNTFPKVVDVFDEANIRFKVSEWMVGILVRDIQSKRKPILPKYFYDFGLWLSKLRDLCGIFLLDVNALNILFRYGFNDIRVCDMGGTFIYKKQYQPYIDEYNATSIFLYALGATKKQEEEFYYGYTGIRKENIRI